MHVPTIVSVIFTVILIVSVEYEPLEIFTSVDWFDFLCADGRYFIDCKRDPSI